MKPDITLVDVVPLKSHNCKIEIIYTILIDMYTEKSKSIVVLLNSNNQYELSESSITESSAFEIVYAYEKYQIEKSCQNKK